MHKTIPTLNDILTQNAHEPTQSDNTNHNATNQNALSHALSQVSKEPLYCTDKQHNRLRWLAFYYLSKRELSQYELHQKLAAKGFDDEAIVPLLQEFAQKDYQSDERFASAVIQSAIKNGKGKRAIVQKLHQAKVDLDALGLDLDAIIAKIVAKHPIQHTPQNWLALAVTARCKKYGDTLPDTPKEKARQFRFLQSRGFETAVCFDALKKTTQDLSEYDE